MAGRPIDEKIVSMKMDNSDFKRKAAETTGLMGRLTSSLNRIPGVNMDKITNSFSGIQRAANSTDLTGLARNVENISSRFSTLGVVATTALTNITNQAVYAGQNLMKSLSTDQIMDGFREYETKMGSIQTILANTQSKGSTLKDVKRNFEELNKYADQTIYSFADMTKNIGLFTNAGLGLDESTSMIKGFSNAAAASGAGSMEAARAAYQLSQGLSSGYIMQMDWMSLTNAGMGNDNMKRDLIALGQAYGTLDESTDHTLKNWKEMLSDDKWLTSDVMSAYLQTMAGDMSKAELMTKGLTSAQADLMIQNAKTGKDAATKVRTFTQFISALKEGIGSGWAETWEIVFGDFEEATKFWTGVSDAITPIFAKQTKARNSFLRAVFDGDGLGNILSGFKNILRPVAQVFGAIGDGFRLAFPPASVGLIKSTVEGFKNLTAGMALSKGTVASIRTIFQGLFSIFALGWKVIKGGAAVFVELLGSFEGLGAKVMELIAKVAKIPIAFNDTTSSGEAFKAFVSGLRTVFDAVAATLVFLVEGLILFAETITATVQALKSGDFSEGPWSKESEISSKLENIRNKVLDVVGGIKQAWGLLTSGDFTSGGPWSEDSGVVKGLLKIRDGAKSLGEYLSNIEWSNITGAFGDFIGFVKDGFSWIIDKAVAVGEAIKNMLPSGNELMAGGFIAGMLAVVGGALKIAWDVMQSFTGWGKIGQGVSEVLEGVSDSLNAFSFSLRVQAIMTIAIALGILAGALWVISKIPVEKIGSVLTTLIISLGALVGAMVALDKNLAGNTGLKTAAQIVALAIAFGILAGALKKISNMEWSEIAKGLIGLAGVMGVFTGAIVLMGKFGGSGVQASAFQMLAIAGTVLLLVLAIKKIADIPTGELVKGMTGLAVALGIFAGALVVMSKFGGAKIGASAVQLVAIAGAVLMIVGAIKLIANIDVENLKKGLITVGLILTAIAAFTVVTKGAGMMSAGVGITLIAVALNLLIVPIAALGNMNMSTLAKGLGAMAIALVAIAAASKLMTGAMAMGAGLMMIAVALNAFIIPITVLGNLPLGVLATGIIALAGAILLIGGAAALLGLAGPALLLGAAGIAALGIAMLAAGAGLSLFSAGLVTLAGMTAAAVTTIVATLGTLIVGLATLIPSAVAFMVKLILSMAQALTDNVPKLAVILLDGLLKMLDVIAKYIPKFVEAATNIITGFLDSLTENIPRIVESASNLMVTFVESLAEAVRTNGPRLVQAVMDIFAEILILVVQAGASVVEALFGWIPGVSEAANDIGNSAEETIRKAFDAKGAGYDKGSDFASGVGSKSGAAKAAGNSVGASAKAGANSANLKTVGNTKGVEFTSGLASKTGSARSAGSSLASSGKSGAGSVSLNGTGSSFAGGFISGISQRYNDVVSAAKSMATKASNAVNKWLDINSPSRRLRKSGNSFGEGMQMGIHDQQANVVGEAKTMAQKASSAVNKFLGGLELPTADNEIHFKAVVDYDEVDPNGFGKLRSIAVGPDTSLTNGLVATSKESVINGKVRAVVDSSQNGNNNSELRQQLEVHAKLLEQQNEYLFNISKKDNSLYLDGREIYNTNKSFQDNQTLLRNIFKGVSTT